MGLLNRVGALAAIIAATAGASVAEAQEGAKDRKPSEFSLTLQEPKTSSVPVGSLVAPVPRVRLLDAANRPLEGVLVRARLAETNGVLNGDTALTDKSGYASFDRLQVFARPGDAVVYFTAGGALAELRLKLTSGSLTDLVVVQQPRLSIKNDSLVLSSSVVRAMDGNGNSLAAIQVVAQLQASPSDREYRDKVCPREADGSGTLWGTAARATNSEGEATFDDLGIVAPCGEYVLEYIVQLPGSTFVTASSNPLRYDPDFSLNRSYVVASAIKSISGQQPDDEFFDVRFRFRLARSVFMLASSDIALTGRDSATSETGEDSLAQTSSKRLTEAGFSLNYRLATFRDGITSAPNRSAFVGYQAKIFNTLTYHGPQLGIVELGGSVFHGSSITLSYLHPIVVEDVIIQGQRFTSQEHNLYLEFFLRSSKVPFFQTLTLRGGVLIPLERGDTQSRIAVAVPVGTIDLF